MQNFWVKFLGKLCLFLIVYDWFHCVGKGCYEKIILKVACCWLKKYLDCNKRASTEWIQFLCNITYTLGAGWLLPVLFWPIYQPISQIKFHENNVIVWRDNFYMIYCTYFQYLFRWQRFKMLWGKTNIKLLFISEIVNWFY